MPSELSIQGAPPEPEQPRRSRRIASGLDESTLEGAALIGVERELERRQRACELPRHDEATEGKVREYTPILTTVHALQIIDERLPMRGHDIPVDFVITPDQVVAAPSLHPRPRGVIWEILQESKILSIPVLRRGRRDVRGTPTPRRL